MRSVQLSIIYTCQCNTSLSAAPSADTFYSYTCDALPFTLRDVLKREVKKGTREAKREAGDIRYWATLSYAPGPEGRGGLWREPHTQARVSLPLAP
jgi:hypothetical protein